MSPSIFGSPHVSEDLLALRHLITRHADCYGLDLSDMATVRRFLDGDFSAAQASAGNYRGCQELRAMLTLYFRLEASSSEDIGIAGLRRLWRQHSEILTRFNLREPPPTGLANERLST